MTDNANHIVFHVEKLICLVSAGLCQAIKHDSISVVEAERLLYTPATMEILKKIGASEHVINLVHQGTELNDVLRLVPDTFFLRCLN